MADGGSDSPSAARRAVNTIRPPEHRSIRTEPRDPASALVDARGSNVLATVAEVAGWVVVSVTVVVATWVLYLGKVVGDPNSEVVNLHDSTDLLVWMWATLSSAAVGLILVVVGRVLHYAKAAATLAAESQLERSC